MILELENVSAGYGMVQILRDINFKVNEKEIVSIIGPNGAGKTTLVRTIMGLIKPSAGSIKFKGENIEKIETYDQQLFDGINYLVKNILQVQNFSLILFTFSTASSS